jgi:hypothetical protein
MSLHNPKTEFWAQNQYGRVIFHVIGSFTCSKKKYTLGGQKGENKPSELKTEFGPQNQYHRVTCPSIGNFTCSIRKYILLGVKNVKMSLQNPKTEFGAHI